MLIEYIKLDGAKRAYSVRFAESGRAQYCFGLNVWRGSVRRAWRDFLQTQEIKTRARDGRRNELEHKSTKGAQSTMRYVIYDNELHALVRENFQGPKVFDSIFKAMNAAMLCNLCTECPNRFEVRPELECRELPSQAISAVPEEL